MAFRWKPQDLSYEQYQFLQDPNNAFKNSANIKQAQSMLGFEGTDVDGKIGPATRNAYNSQMPYYHDLYGKVNKAGALDLNDPNAFYEDMHAAETYGFTPQEAEESLNADIQQEEAAAKQQRIKEIEAEIAAIEQRIAERKRGMAANEDALNTQLAAIEARKINQKDPTSIWRWKAQMDENRRIANAQNKTDNTAKANAMIEIANDLDSIIVDDTMTSQDKKAYLSKLSNMKTLGEKAGVPKSVIDSINAKIDEVKGENKSGSEGQAQSEYKKGTKVENADKAADELLAKPDLTQGDIAKFKRDNPNISDGKLLELNKKHNELIDRDKKKNEAIKKARGLVGRTDLNSNEIEFMSGMKGFKKKSDDFGNIWFEEVL